MRIHTLIQSNSHPNCNRMAEEFEISTRTVKRDVDFMKYRLNLPIEYDSRKYGYYYTKPVPQFPSVQVTEAEMFSLLIAHKAIAQYQGTPFEKPLRSAFDKLSGQLDNNTNYTLGNWDNALSFRPFAPDDSDLKTFQLLTRALQQKLTLKFQYKKLGASAREARTVQPYHLTCVENHWYLIGFDTQRRAIRTFALNRLSSPQLTKRTFNIPAHFNPEEYLKGSFGVFKGPHDFEVLIQFDRWAADLIRGRKWHSTQLITETPGGGLRMAIRLNNLEEIERWILSWGTHATVVRPEVLAQRLKAISTEITAKYSNPSSLPTHKTPVLPI